MLFVSFLIDLLLGMELQFLFDWQWDTSTTSTWIEFKQLKAPIQPSMYIKDDTILFGYRYNCTRSNQTIPYIGDGLQGNSAPVPDTGLWFGLIHPWYKTMNFRARDDRVTMKPTKSSYKMFN